MGLDMYLYKKSYVKNWNHTPDEQKHKVTIKMGNKVRKDIKPERVSHIVEEVAYWRKFNALHNWFVQNCAGGEDDCKEMYVEKSLIKGLIVDLKTIKESLDKSDKKKVSVQTGWSSKGDIYTEIDVFTDTSLAEALFPTAAGFFFGGTEYGMMYYEDIVETIKVFEDLMAEEDNLPKGVYAGDFYYRASW